MNSFSPNRISRRHCLGLIAGSAVAPLFRSREGYSKTNEALPPVRAITSGPRHHFFGYYDKFQFDVSGRYVLGLAVNFEHRLPRADDVIEVGMIDLQDSDRWIPLGKTRSWSWQQGCMLQWMPGSETKVLWNDRVGDRFVCRILDIATHESHDLPNPIYTLHPDGQSAITADFRRLRTLRPDTGYAGVVDPFADQLAPQETGLWQTDMKTGSQRLIVSFADAANFGDVTDEMRSAKHFFEHPTYNPDGSRVAFLHRWRANGGASKAFRTRLLTVSPEGKDLFVLDPSGHTSHTAWLDRNHLLAYTRPKSARSDRRFCLFADREGEIAIMGEDTMLENGHCTYLPGGEWLLNDTYPDSHRLQHPYLYHVKTNRCVPLGHFSSPSEYTGAVRCDTHPRLSRDSKSVVIDSPHGGNGRQMYLIDISSIVG